jgi:hypothetical protein
MVRNFQNHHSCILTSPEPLLEYIEWIESNVGKTFDLLLRSTGPGTFRVADQAIAPIERTVVVDTTSQIEFAKRRIASRGDERAGLTDEVVEAIKRNYAVAHPGKEYRKVRTTPLLMVMFVDIGKEKKERIVGTFGIGFPGDPGARRRPLKLVQYRVNTVWWEKNVLIPENDEEEDDDS